MRSRFLNGTRVDQTMDAAALAAGFAALRRRGRLADRLRRVGCVALVPVVGLGVWALVQGQVWAVGLYGLGALLLARLAAHGDPELADDPRARLLEALFSDWSGPEPITLHADLNAPDMTAPDESERIAGGVIRNHYVQPWLRIELPAGQWLELVHERTQIEDGVEVREVVDHHRLVMGELREEADELFGPDVLRERLRLRP